MKKGLRMLMLLSAALAVSAHAQDAPPPVQPPTSVITAQDLAKSVHNPFEDFVKLSIQSTTGFELGPHHNVGDSFNIQPLVPFSLNAQWDLIARPSLTVTYLPSPHEQFGLADLQTSFFLTPAKATTWIWGVGPIFQLPTASSPELGTGRWSAGPTAALIYSEGPWFKRHNRVPTHVVCWKSQSRQCESDPYGARNQLQLRKRLVRPLRSRNYVQPDSRRRQWLDYSHGCGYR